MPYRPDDPVYSNVDRVYTEQLTWPEWIVVRRLRLYWTKEDLADRCGVTRTSLWRFEMNRGRPSERTRARIEMALDEGEMELAGETGAVGVSAVASK